MATAATLEILSSQAARWAVAARQDQEPFVKLLHANYAMGYVLALRQVASDQEVLRKIGVDPYALEREVSVVQMEAASYAARRAPGLQPSDGLARLAKESFQRDRW